MSINALKRNAMWNKHIVTLKVTSMFPQIQILLQHKELLLLGVMQ